MSITKLPLTVDTLASEPVLVAAWKKAEAYIRQHNWYADVLELDRTNADLECVLHSISAEIKATRALKPNELRLVLAPKSQKWEIDAQSNWRPTKEQGANTTEAADRLEVLKRLRPLAHATVRDQIIAMAFAILFADAIETTLGDPRSESARPGSYTTVSYGNRLLCGREDHALRFRWGSTTSYRKYFQDYQTFVSRPRTVVAEKFKESKNWAIIHADLSQFYDRVRPKLLHEKVGSIVGAECEAGLIDRFMSFFDWRWDPSDHEAVRAYADRASPKILDFETIALPQGLVASGFFANAVLIDFDRAVIADLGIQYSDRKWQLVDYCRYVDDMRMVVNAGGGAPGQSKKGVSEAVLTVFEQYLHQHAPGLELNKDKAQVVLGRESANGERPLAAMMERIAHNTSGVMDLFLAEETLDTLDNLLPPVPDVPMKFGDKFRDTFPEVAPDVQDATVARFSAHRFRRVFRQSRPMSEDQPDGKHNLSDGISRQYLDQKASHFSRRLIERWVGDPSNVRLLRVALDLRPDPKVLKMIIGLLSQHMGNGSKPANGAAIVATYCAAELLRAGATETGNVADPDQLPADCGVNHITEYRDALADFARSCKASGNTWYLRKQADLFLLVMETVGIQSDNPVHGEAFYASRDPAQMTLLQRHYQSTDSAAMAFLRLMPALAPELARHVVLKVLKADQDLAEAIWNKLPDPQQQLWRAEFIAHGASGHSEFPNHKDKTQKPTSYSLISLGRSPLNPFQQEYAALCLAIKLLKSLRSSTAAISAAEVFVITKDWRKLKPAEFPIEKKAFTVKISRGATPDARFVVPNWVNAERRTGYQLGQLLRVALTGRPDFTLPAQRPMRTTNLRIYRPYRSAWLTRGYGLFNGRNAFGPAWLPISSWLGSLLARLLEWPGFDRQDSEVFLPEGFNDGDLAKLINQRIKKLEKMYGRSSRTPFLPVTLPRDLPKNQRSAAEVAESFYEVRVAVVQTAFPSHASFKANDSQLADPATRREHRRHLSAVLGGVRRMLQVRGTHHPNGSGLELLVLPELAVHPDDVQTILVPFARQHRCMVCAGIVFHPRRPGGKLINSAQWILPVRSAAGGLNFQYIVQGKYHLTQEEKNLKVAPFRPAQWVFELTNSNDPKRKWSMTGSICYDATDLCLAADLRDRTDLFVVPALNRDVGTFHNMVAALHYHMFQHVIVANSGGYPNLRTLDGFWG